MNQSKEIGAMFDRISRRYDRANRWITFGLDRYWRKRVARFLPEGNNLTLLDCATGTGDQILSVLRQTTSIGKAIGLDFSEEMLRIAETKIANTPLRSVITFEKGDILSLPYPDASFDCVTISFGIRNVPDVGSALQQLLRVLKPGGRLLVLETSVPENRFLRFFYRAYTSGFLPLVGGIISGERSPYTYLQKTARKFPSGKDFLKKLIDAGFGKTVCKPMTGGAVSLYIADKTA